MEKYKKRYRREKGKNKHKNKEIPTPRTRVKQLLCDSTKKKEVSRRLLFAETITDQLNENYNTLRSQKEKRYLRKVLCGKLIRKNRLISMYHRKLRVYKDCSDLNRKLCKRRTRKDKLYVIELKKRFKVFSWKTHQVVFYRGRKIVSHKGK